MVSRYRPCPTCQGEGYPTRSSRQCAPCRGSGCLYYQGLLSSENQLVGALKEHLVQQGYQVLVDPGGGSFLDLVAVRVKQGLESGTTDALRSQGQRVLEAYLDPEGEPGPGTTRGRPRVRRPGPRP